jgi:hypothetical protein
MRHSPQLPLCKTGLTEGLRFYDCQRYHLIVPNGPAPQLALRAAGLQAPKRTQRKFTRVPAELGFSARGRGMRSTRHYPEGSSEGR